MDDLISRQAEQQGRVFKEIVVEYPSISTYPEYEGKPYFSIKYMENGQEFIGYGTYKPEVLSEYLKEYFIPPAQPETHEKRTETHACDCISRQRAIDAVKRNTFRLTFAEEQNYEGHVAWSAEAVYSDVMEGALLELPPAQPESLTDKEQRIFLSAMGREEKVCKKVDDECCRELYEGTLVEICHEITRKVKGVLWMI